MFIGGETMINIFYEKNGQLVRECKLESVEILINSPNLKLLIQIINPDDDEMDFLTNHLCLHTITLKNYNSDKQIPKIEEYDKYISTIMYDINYSESNNEFIINPVNIIVLPNITVVLSTKDFNSFGEIYSRISTNPIKAFNSASNIYYIILDVLVDNLFQLLEVLEDRLYNIQEEILNKEITFSNGKIIDIRKKLLAFKKFFSYEQEVLYKISHEQINLIESSQIAFMKDVYHHLEKLNSTLSEYNDWASNLSDAIMSYSSAKLNDNLQILTIISFIFLPLSFLTGWYGMNFKYMPELELDYGYFYFIIFVVVLTIGLIFYFRRKKLL
jgi:magnesium transporter